MSAQPNQIQVQVNASTSPDRKRPHPTLQSGKRWSKYNLLFKSKRNGYLLYNALSNHLAALDQDIADLLIDVSKGVRSFDPAKNFPLYVQLLLAKVLVDDIEEDNHLESIHHQRNIANYDTSNLMLTIAPTLGCNFDCPYCFEKNKRGIHMRESVEKKVIDWIAAHANLRYISITWYGGEPLLRFNTMVALSEKIESLGIPFFASVITNGYLITEDIARKLTSLKIKTVQITLDGDQHTHDQRRTLVSGRETYTRILESIQYLIDNWDGRIIIRQNIDRENRDSYSHLHAELVKRFPTDRLSIYASLVRSAAGELPDLACQMDRKEMEEFRLENHEQHGISPGNTFPDHDLGGCTATRQNGFVIGPKGELYKCWMDLGVKEMEVGHVDGGLPLKQNIVAQYTTGSDNFSDPECRRCFFLPICSGGCAQLRVENKYYDAKHDTCFRFKDTLPEILEIHYENKSVGVKKKPSNEFINVTL